MYCNIKYLELLMNQFNVTQVVLKKSLLGVNVTSTISHLSTAHFFYTLYMYHKFTLYNTNIYIENYHFSWLNVVQICLIHHPHRLHKVVSLRAVVSEKVLLTKRMYICRYAVFYIIRQYLSALTNIVCFTFIWIFEITIYCPWHGRLDNIMRVELEKDCS